MSLSELASGIATALADAKQKLAGVNQQIEKTKAERARIEHQMPHTTDIIRAFTRDLAEQSNKFEREMEKHFSMVNIRDHSAAAEFARSSPTLLTIGGFKPLFDGQQHPLLPTRRDRHGNDLPIEMAAITYFLRDIIAAALPGLIAKTWPTAVDGITQADRAAALAEVDVKLSALNEEKTRLVGEINSAIKAVGPR